MTSPGSGRQTPQLSSVPDYSGGTAPDSHRVPDCLEVQLVGILLTRGRGFVKECPATEMGIDHWQAVDSARKRLDNLAAGGLNFSF